MKAPSPDPQRIGFRLAGVQRQYLAFFLPLALTSLMQAASFQVRNAVLARFPHPARELATFSFALSTFFLLWALNNFVPQMTNVLGRSARGRRVTRNTTWLVNGVMTLVLLVLALTPTGRWLLAQAFSIGGSVLDGVREYLLWLAPSMLISGHLQWREGLLVQSRRTGLLTSGQLSHLVVSSAWLLGAMWQGSTPVAAIIGSTYAGYAVLIPLNEYFVRRYYIPPKDESHQDLTYRTALRFLLPAAASGAILNFSRPLLYACLSRTTNPLLAVASLRVAYDLLAVIQGISNQFRHLFASFGLDDISGKRRFMLQVALILFAALFSSTIVPPATVLVFQHLLGLKGEMLEQTVATAQVISYAPLLLIWRNFFHAQLLAHSETQGMAVASSARLALLITLTPLLLMLDRLSAQSAAMVLLLGFACEAAISGWALRRVTRAVGSGVAVLR